MIIGVPERTQRHYCKIAKVERKRNIAIGRKYTPENVKEAAWQHGRAVFDFFDSQGKQGRKGGHYLAWHLPNSYTGPHQQSPKGRMRKINRKLVDLVNPWGQGNGGETIEKLYFANGKEAGRALNQGVEANAYWSLVVSSNKNGLWAIFSLA